MFINESNDASKHTVTLPFQVNLVKDEMVKLENPDGLKFEASDANPFRIFGFRIPQRRI